MEDGTLEDALIASGAVRFGEFDLAAGGTSSYYVDKYRFETAPATLALIAAAFAEDLLADRIAGVALGGVPLAVATSLHTEIPYLIARKRAKAHGTAQQVEGELGAGDTVVLLEDIATTGMSAADAVASIRDAGGVVEEVRVVVDREEGATGALEEVGVRMRALCTASDLLARTDT
ncbi:MAG: orotate phosphoribosyltransferase [Haloquadratum sp.]|jgi:orotate phosphoribosyltransferase|nr:orotate phosphoribosyltransferase [Haloferacaceae archaeon]MDR9445649.1 orotate phosphoribosyltransferase [Haloquadratum sp.]